MLTISFESSAKSASVALTRDGILLAQSFQNNGLTHSRTLLPMAEDLLKNCGVDKRELERVAVARGPGSFTGVRIGVSVAKGLCWALDIPACGVSTLEAMAWQGIFAPEGSLLCCAMDARRDQVYNAVFRVRQGRPVRLCPDRAISIAELDAEFEAAVKKIAEKEVILLGDGAERCYNTLRGAVLPPQHLRLQSAYGVALAAEGAPDVSCHNLLPLYLRVSQAERERATDNEQRITNNGQP
ncbi:MAG: tRNA (adenosine(37)-N6)-threonylcarbamoyltransferase complex dimerization subunit type 1 TsaB [Firmicutes bacterium]|nr:tRNA (adenosine(37)-N6)-threonylcarbamoyltransferase complex dimerization subunit type 1 TsaB [Bacillota bacterium]